MQIGQNNPIENKTQPVPIEISKLALEAGKSIKLSKWHNFGASDQNFKQGDYIEGELIYSVDNVGKPVWLKGNKDSLGIIEGATLRDDRIFLKIGVIVYELILDNQNNQNEKSKILTKSDWEREINIFNKKSYEEWDLVNNRVPVQDDPYYLLFINNGYKKGDEVEFFAEKVRRGKLSSNNRGELIISDSEGNPWGIFAILNDPNGWIKKA